MGIDQFLDHWVNPTDTANDEQRRKGRLFAGSLWLLVVLGAPYTLYTFVLYPAMWLQNLIQLLMLTLLLGILLLYRRYPWRVGLINGLTVLLFSQLVGTYFNGGLYSSDNIWLVTFSAWVFLVGNRSSGFAWFALSALYLVVLFLADSLAWRPFAAELTLDRTFVFVNYMVSVLFLGTIVYWYDRAKDGYFRHLLQARHHIEQKNQLLENQQRDLLAGITYAGRIQAAVLPQPQLWQPLFTNSFVLSLPKQIVSGDFYFVRALPNALVVAVADCTGHGVPGSLMTMLGSTLLQQVIAEADALHSGALLDQLRLRLKQALQQSATQQAPRDGMDLGLCIIWPAESRIQFSGANRPLLRYSQQQWYEYLPDRMPIGHYPKEKPFAAQDIHYLQGDSFYLFSDGLTDQLGGPDQRTFQYARFKSLLQQLSTLPMPQQAEQLHQHLAAWQGTLPQTDDVLVMGFVLDGEIMR